MESKNAIGTEKRAKKPPPRNAWSGWFRYFQYDQEHDKPGDARNVLLIIAALIAAVTFQSGVNPPGGVWQDGNGNHHAGTAIYASQPKAFYVFLVSNTLALSTSILIIVSLTYRFPLHFEIWVATVSMIITYGSAVFAVTPHESVKFRYILFAAALPFLLRCLIQTFKMIRFKVQDLEREKQDTIMVQESDHDSDKEHKIMVQESNNDQVKQDGD